MMKFDAKTVVLDDCDFLNPQDTKNGRGKLTPEAEDACLRAEMVFYGKYCIKNRYGGLTKKDRIKF